MILNLSNHIVRDYSVNTGMSERLKFIVMMNLYKLYTYYILANYVDPDQTAPVSINLLNFQNLRMKPGKIKMFSFDKRLSTCISGAGYSKLTTLLVNALLNFK